jgi:hypothetical protein
VIPEAAFGLGEVSTQVFGAIARFYVPLHSAPSPRSAPRSRPLPLKGARGAIRHVAITNHGGLAVNA